MKTLIHFKRITTTSWQWLKLVEQVLKLLEHWS
ncbi:hypothetical protein EBU24_03130 [bacterium]|nr:hypothetical protein [bacterium]